MTYRKATQKVLRNLDLSVKMAERVGFEPTVELPLHNISNVAPSTTRPSLHHRVRNIKRNLIFSSPFSQTNCFLFLPFPEKVPGGLIDRKIRIQMLKPIVIRRKSIMSLELPAVKSRTLIAAEPCNFRNGHSHVAIQIPTALLQPRMYHILHGSTAVTRMEKTKQRPPRHPRLPRKIRNIRKPRRIPSDGFCKRLSLLFRGRPFPF